MLHRLINRFFARNPDKGDRRMVSVARRISVEFFTFIEYLILFAIIKFIATETGSYFFKILDLACGTIFFLLIMTYLTQINLKLFKEKNDKLALFNFIVTILITFPILLYANSQISLAVEMMGAYIGL